MAKLATALDLKIALCSKLLPHEMGFIKNIDGQIILAVYKYLPLERMIFIIAHQIGHYIYHRDYLNQGLIDYSPCRDGELNELEREANDFAAELLMPEAIFTGKLLNREYPIAKVAEDFCVTKSAVITRAMFLKLVAEDAGFFI